MYNDISILSIYLDSEGPLSPLPEAPAAQKHFFHISLPHSLLSSYSLLPPLLLYNTHSTSI